MANKRETKGFTGGIVVLLVLFVAVLALAFFTVYRKQSNEMSVSSSKSETGAAAIPTAAPVKSSADIEKATKSLDDSSMDKDLDTSGLDADINAVL